MHTVHLTGDVNMNYNSDFSGETFINSRSCSISFDMKDMVEAVMNMIIEGEANSLMLEVMTRLNITDVKITCKDEILMPFVTKTIELSNPRY